MKRKRGKERSQSTGDQLPAKSFLQAVPQVNRAMILDRRSDGTALASVPIRRSKHLIPPFSWLLPYSSHRRVELDAVGAEVLGLCDGISTVADEIRIKTAPRRLLTFWVNRLSMGKQLPTSMDHFKQFLKDWAATA